MKNKSLYALEGLACICVVFIHCRLPGKLGLNFLVFSRFAVPFFFMVSGFFTLNASKDKLKKKALNLLKLFGVASAIYITLFLMQHCVILEEYSLQAGYEKIFCKETFHDLIIYNNTGYGEHLWFLPSLIYCYIFKYLTTNTKFKKLYKFIPLLLISTYIYVVYACMHNERHIFYYRNWYAMAIPFYMLGATIRMYKDKLVKIQTKWLVLATGIGFASMFVENTIYRMINKKLTLEYYIGTVLFLIPLFILVVKKPNIFSKFKMLSFIGEKLSLYVYIYHYLFIEIIFHIYGKLNKIVYRKEIKSILILSVSLLFALLIYVIKEQIQKLKKKKEQPILLLEASKLS